MTTSLIDDVMINFHSDIGPEKLKALIKQFNPQKNNNDLFKILWDMEDAHKYVNVILVKRSKSETEACRLEELADHYFKEGNLSKALETYNSSLMMAPHHPVDISLNKENSCKIREKIQINDRSVCQNYESLYRSYAKRSEVLFELEHYEHCLVDIMLANGCSQQQSELGDRRKECLAKLESAKVRKNNKSAVVSDNFGKDSSVIPRFLKANSSVPSFSSACKIAYTPEKGRHILAVQCINTGEVLAVEKAYCTTLYEECHSKHCATCTQGCVAPIPCPECNMAVFCSLSCRQEGLSGTHLLECSVLPTLYAMDMMPYFGIAYKLLCKATCSQWKETVRKLEERAKKCPPPPEDRGKNENGIYISEDFESVYNLCTNVKERPSGDLYAKCFVAFVLTKLLELSGRFFVDDSGRPVPPSTEDAIFAGQFIFDNMMKFSSNGFSVANFQVTGPPYSIDQKDVGSGVYATMSLLNHSCHPNALPFSYGDCYVLRAARQIQEGDEVTISYSRGSYLQAIDTRQQNLWDRYQFECSCEACGEEWPTYKDLPELLEVRCTACFHAVDENERKCQNCLLDFTEKNDDVKKQVDIDIWKARVEEVKAAKDDVQRMMKIFPTCQSLTKQDSTTICKAIDILEKYVPHPSRILWDAKDTLEFYFHREKNSTYQ